MSIATISPVALAERAKTSRVDIIDVRTPMEYAEVHAEGAQSLPLDKIDATAVQSLRKGEGPLYLICKSGGRGQKACEKLVAAGYADVVNVEGGTTAWEAAGLPVVRGKKVMSLERQVRIAAGALVLLGVTLGFTVHEGLFGISAFVGAGLMFAGITDTCAMGMLMAKMPWNQRNSGQCAVK